MKYKKIIIRAMCALVIFVVSVGTIANFSTQLQRALMAETYRTLSELSVDYNKAFLDRISYNIKTMKVLAGGLEEIEGQTMRDLMQILQNAAKDGGFAQMVVCDAKGITCSSDGVFRDVSHRDYFKKAMRGEIDVSNPLISMVSEEETIVISVPIYGKDTIVGVLFGIYPLKTAGEQFLKLASYSDGYGFIVTQDGTMVMSSEHADKLANEQNLFAFLEKVHFLKSSTAEVRRAVADGESGSFAFTYEGQRRFVSFTPTKINDWYTFSLSSDAMMLQQEKITNQIVIKLVVTLAVVAALLLAWIIVAACRHNRELRRANQKYQSLLSHINGGVVVATHSKNPEEILSTYVSPGFTEMTGYTLEDLQQLHQGQYLAVMLEEDRQAALEQHLAQTANGNSYQISYRIRKKDGTILWAIDNGYLVEDADGRHNHSILTDITVIRQQEEALRMSEKRFSVAVNASSGTLFELDLERQVYTHFENSARIFGVNAEILMRDTRAFSTLPFDEFVDAVTGYFFHPDDCEKAKIGMSALRSNKTTSYEARLRRYDGSYIWARIDLSLSVNEAGEPSRLVGFMSDIDDIKKQAELLEGKVQTDPMTGLYNKIAMATLANKVLEEHANGLHALIVLDVDNFKGINDTLGHAFGDLVLIEVATKLKIAFRNNDVVGRMGGDEFAILMQSVPDTSSVLKKATELSASFRQTYAGEKEEYHISCSIGIIIANGNTDSFEMLYRKADAALYQAKQHGKDQFVLYREEDAENYPIQVTRTNDEELQNLEVSHNIEAQIFELLYTAKDFSISINMALAVIGQHYHASRVTIFENDEENLVTNNLYEWCNEGISSELARLQNVPIAANGESILDSFDRSGLLYCSDVRELSPYARAFFQMQGVRSTLQVTIANDEKLCGFIGFDECKESRMWTSEEIENLSFLAKVISVFLFKKKTESALLDNLNTRLRILDVLPDYICVVNPETHSLVYANSKMQELLPSAQAGAFCFSMLRGGQRAPCEVCLVERIKRGDTENLEIISEDKKLHLAVNAITIHWTNDKTMVLLYGIKKPQSKESPEVGNE